MGRPLNYRSWNKKEINNGNGWASLESMDGSDITKIAETALSAATEVSLLKGDDSLETQSKKVIGAINELHHGKQTKISSSSIVISTANWNGMLSCTIPVSGVSSDNVVWVTPDPGSYELFSDAQIRAVSQAEGTLTFACSEIPTIDIYINIAIA